jgi:hypothetical protein
VKYWVKPLKIAKHLKLAFRYKQMRVNGRIGVRVSAIIRVRIRVRIRA